MDKTMRTCGECGSEIRRRDFVKAVAGAALAASIGPSRLASAAASVDESSPEERVKALYRSLNSEQKAVVSLPWEDPRRMKVVNNWAIVKPTIGSFYTQAQQEIIREIFRGLVSEDGYERFQKQMKDDYGGFQNYHCCIFGNPDGGEFEWVMTGRHLTIRCDGESTRGAAFGGPIFYGHAVEFNEKPDHPGNVWWHQARLANAIFASLDGKQREKALLTGSPPDTQEGGAIKTNLCGLPVSELSKDQKPLVEQVMKDILAPYRKRDVEEAMQFIRQEGGLDAVHMAFYRDGDLGDDGIWDRWSLQGPTLSWYFRGSPHVHTWVSIGSNGG